MIKCRHILYLALSTLTLISVSAQAASDSDRRNAKKLYERITGVKVNSSNKTLSEVAALLAKNQKSEAVKKITQSPDFLNVQIRNLALRLSNKDESVKVGFNDFAALIVGTVRDNRDFRNVLTGDYGYNVKGVVGDDDPRIRHYSSTTFARVESNHLDLTTALQFVPKQTMAIESIPNSYPLGMASNAVLKEVNQRNPAGVLTTRTFAERNLSGGTNRRAVEFALKQFLCVSMAEAADANASDQYVGKDVERFPAGDHNKYLTSCKSCHSVMDGMRPAFAKHEYARFFGVSGAISYSILDGDLFNSEDVQKKRDDFNTQIVNPAIALIIPDMELNQTKSIYYTTRYNYLIKRGTTVVAAKTEVDNALSKVRDTTLLAQLAEEYALQNSESMDSIIRNVKTANFITNYGATCLNHLATKNVLRPEQERRFLVCDLDRRKETSLVYVHYRNKLMKDQVSAATQEMLLGKMLNKGRNSNVFFAQNYLEATNASRIFPQNAFDSETGVASKLNKGNYSYGFTVRNDRFVNNADLGNKADFFGWRGPNKDGGSGIKEFGRMLADSKRFSQCFAKRAYESVCLKKLDSTKTATLQRLGNRFEALGYNLKNFYGEVALDSACGIMN